MSLNYMTLLQGAKALGCSAVSVKKYAGMANVEMIRVGSAWAFPADKLEDLRAHSRNYAKKPGNGRSAVTNNLPAKVHANVLAKKKVALSKQREKLASVFAGFAVVETRLNQLDKALDREIALVNSRIDLYGDN